MRDALSAPEHRLSLTLIAVGSDVGADSVAWRVAEHLGLDHERCRSPITELPGLLAGRTKVVILDALLTAPDDIQARILQLNTIQAANPGTATHGFGVADTLRLIDEFDYLPAQIDLIGLPIHASQTSVSAMRIETLSAQVRALIDERDINRQSPPPLTKPPPQSTADKPQPERSKRSPGNGRQPPTTVATRTG